MSVDNNLTNKSHNGTYELELDKHDKKSVFQACSVRNLFVIIFLITGVGFTALSSKKSAKISAKISELFRTPAPRDPDGRTTSA